MILLISPKQVYATKRFIEEAKKLKVALKAFDAKDLAKKGFKIDITKYRSLFIRQGWPYVKEIISLAKRFQAAGKKVVDTSITTGSLGRDKWADYQKLKAAGLPMPKTKSLILNPLSLTYPWVLKWNYGFKGRGVFLIENKNQLQPVLKKYPKEELLMQEFIPAEYEYKIITVGYKSLPVILRFKIDEKTKRPDFNTACSVPIYRLSKRPINGRATNIIEIAEKASKVLRRELAKVDILEAQGKFYILEVNRWPGLQSFEELTEYNAAQDFLKYLVSNSCID
jgi:glutathione synthase/RimK-type ligase-like ATP-grasp enzyme